MKSLYIIDAYNLIYRMFYAIPEMHTRAGESVNALFGVIKFLKWLAEMEGVDEIIIASESGSNFRETLYTEYKGTRDRMPDGLRSQIPLIFSFFEKAGIPVFVREGYEADDIIGSLATQITDREIVIISSDKDLCQFVRDGHVRIYDAMKQKNMYEKDVLEKFGVGVSQVRDYLAIVGDTSDNIPGISGFGPKKAVDLLTRYDTLEGIYSHLEDLTPKMRESLENERENAFLSQKLADIVTDLDLSDITLDAWLPDFLSGEVLALLQEYEFRSLLPKSHQISRLSVSRESIEKISEREFSEIMSVIQLGTDPLYLYRRGSDIGFRYQGKNFLLDPLLDPSPLLDLLVSKEDSIDIIGYDLKPLYRDLLRRASDRTSRSQLSLGM